MNELFKIIISWVKPLSIITTILSLIAVIFKILTSIKKYQEIEKNKIPRFPPKKISTPYFSLESSDPKSVEKFIGFFNEVDNEIVELDIVVCEDEKGLIDVSREYMEINNELSSDYLIIWTPYREFSDNEKANASNSEGFALNIIYTPESDAKLFYNHGCWYLKGFFTVLPGVTNMGVCSIPIRAEKVQRRRS